MNKLILIRRSFCSIASGWRSSRAPCGSVFYFNESTKVSTWTAPLTEEKLEQVEPFAPTAVSVTSQGPDTNISLSSDFAASEPATSFSPVSLMASTFSEQEPSQTMHADAERSTFKTLADKAAKRARALEARIARADDIGDVHKLRKRVLDYQEKSKRFMALHEQEALKATENGDEQANSTCSANNLSHSSDSTYVENQPIAMTELAQRPLSDSPSLLNILLTLRTEVATLTAKSVELDAQVERLRVETLKIIKEATDARESLQVAKLVVKRLESELTPRQ